MPREFLSCLPAGRSIFSSCCKMSLWVMIISRILVNILMIWIFTRIAISLFKTEESMATPCSVKQKGGWRKPIFSELEVANCVLQFSSSSTVISNIKSLGNRSIFLRIASFNLLVSTPYNSAKSLVQHYFLSTNQVNFIHHEFVRDHYLFVGFWHNIFWDLIFQFGISGNFEVTICDFKIKQYIIINYTTKKVIQESTVLTNVCKINQDGSMSADRYRNSIIRK